MREQRSTASQEIKASRKKKMQEWQKFQSSATTSSTPSLVEKVGDWWRRNMTYDGRVNK